MLILYSLLKSNRQVSLSKVKKQGKKYIHIELMHPGQQTVRVFKNADDTVGGLNLAFTDLNLSYKLKTTIYNNRWGV
jgi:hypothetical protein